MKAYTIFSGDELLEDVTDDMNSTEDWSNSGRLWLDRKMAQKSLDYYKICGVGTDLRIVEVKINI